MRISDWSSDVCSSDLGVPGDADVGRRSRRDFGIETAIDVELELAIGRAVGKRRAPDPGIETAFMADGQRRLHRDLFVRQRNAAEAIVARHRDAARQRERAGGFFFLGKGGGGHRRRGDKRTKARARSEEHTSELQSLMRISYAVFC